MFTLLVFCAGVLGVFGASLPTYTVPGLDGRIVGGENADIKNYPYQISMRYYGSHRCGGSIIDKRTILTAAHCTDGVSASNVQVAVGTSEKYGGTLYQVARIAIHAKYDSRNIDNDVSVMILAKDLVFGDGINPIALSEKSPIAGEMATVTGWGALKEGSSSPNTLQMVKVPVVSNSDCAKAYQGQITSSMMCAGYTTGGKDACQGDSGGPLVVNDRLAGVVSWGYGCARPNYPGVYADVAALKSWIDSNRY